MARTQKAEETGKGLTVSQQAVAGIRARAPAGFEGLADFGFEIERQLTRSVLAQEDDKPYAVKITGPVHEAPGESSGTRQRRARQKKDKDGNPLPPDQQEAAKDEEKQRPPMICDIINLTTGELQTLVVNSSLEDELNEKFPNEGYVGYCFAFKSKLMPTKDRTRKFRLYTLFQIKEPANIGAKLEKADEEQQAA